MARSVYEQIGDYKIIERIGHGGMGEVWLANKVGFQGMTSACVIKLLHREQAADPKAREMFLNEARLASQLDHPNIVKVIDAGEAADGRLYLVMDRVDGVNLNGFIRAVRSANLPLPLDLDITCYIIGEVLTALEYAHGRTIAGHDAGVVHFDITPNNILISSSGSVKLTDFGLSRVAATNKNVSVIAGTPRYMSIEHHTATPRLASDIYGLGVILHELLTDTRYHEGLEPTQIRQAILHGSIQPLDRDDLPPWLVQLRTQMLAADYTERPAAGVALDIVLRNVPGYRRAAGELAKTYKNTCGPARSGMTAFIFAVPDPSAPAQPASPLGPPDAPPLPPPAPPSPAALPPAAALPPSQDAPTGSAAIPATVVEPATGPTGLGPVPIGAVPVGARSDRTLIAVFVALATAACMALGFAVALVVLLSQDDVDPEPQPGPAAEAAAEAPAPAPAAPAPAPAPLPEAAPAPIPAPIPEAAPAPIPEPEPIPEAEPEPEPEPEAQPSKKAKPPVKLVLFIKGHSEGTVKLGRREYPVSVAAVAKLPPGRYTAKWRTGPDQDWRSAGKVVVEDIAPNYYEVRLGDGAAEQTERSPGSAR